ncbi:MAG TPA: hypothetical protein VK672_07535 [Solirubrobacteraceae bacterium]|nr:hypothetical protein [Solirubrobacteraceae bacterium]
MIPLQAQALGSGVGQPESHGHGTGEHESPAVTGARNLAAGKNPKRGHCNDPTPDSAREDEAVVARYLDVEKLHPIRAIGHGRSGLALSI